MKLPRSWFLIAVGSLALQSLAAQLSPLQLWQGEWGKYERLSGPDPRYRGSRLLISQCTHQSCRVTIQTSTGAGGNCGGSGELRMIDISSARVVMSPSADPRMQVGKPGGKCTLVLVMSNRQGNHIELKAGKECSNLCTAGGTFDLRFPLRSRGEFFGDRIEECFIGDSQARMALCSSKGLADLEKTWSGLRGQIADRYDTGNSNQDINQAIQTTLMQCEHEANPGGCLRGYFEGEISRLDAKKKEWEAAVSLPGDKQKASAQVAALEGVYEEPAQAGTAADKLRIARASETAVHFSTLLHFSNGNQCGLEGTAEYKQSGHFVFRERPDDEHEECIFEIVPTETDIALRDPTGACKRFTCGLGGGYNGAKFSRSPRENKQ